MVRGPVVSDRADRESAGNLTTEDALILERVEDFLDDGRALKRWWEKHDAGDAYAERFELTRSFNQAGISYGFFDRVKLADSVLPVMGNVQEMLYDIPRALGGGSRRDAAIAMRDQIREFALHYFMRVTSFREPEVYVESQRTTQSDFLRRLSWCPSESVLRQGFGFRQLFYKLRDSGRIGRFPEQERFAIIDLRELGRKYEWIVVKVEIFNFSFTFNLLGQGRPQVVVPLEESSYLVLSREFISDEDEPERGLLGQYGLGYAFIKDPQRQALAYGPGQFDAAFELINFRVLNSGETRVRMVFVANRPTGVLNLSLDPVDWSFRLADLMSLGLASQFFGPLKNALDQFPLRDGSVDPVMTYISLANTLTGGAAARELCISRSQLDKTLLLQHFNEHYHAITGSVLTWRQVPDWLDRAALPEWVKTGKSS